MQRKHSSLVSLATLAVAAAALSGCSPSGDTTTDTNNGDPILIGMTASLTGAFQVDGTTTFQGVEYAVDAINADGGWLNRQLKLIAIDDQSDANNVQAAYTKLITQDKVDFIIGPYSPDLASAAATVAARYKKVMLDPSTALPIQAGNKWAIQAEPGADQYMTGMSEVAKNAGYSTIAIVGINNAFGQKCVDGQKAEAKKYGLDVVYSTTYPGNDDFGSISQAIKGSNAQVVVACSYFVDSVALTRGLDSVAYRPKMLGMSIGPSNSKFQSSVGQLAEGVISTTTWEPSLPTEGTKEFIEGFTKKYGVAPEYHSANDYAAMQTLTAAVKATNSLDQQKILDNLYSSTYETVLGTFKLNSDAVVTGYIQYLTQIQDGTTKLIWPENIAETQIKYPY